MVETTTTVAFCWGGRGYASKTTQFGTLASEPDLVPLATILAEDAHNGVEVIDIDYVINCCNW